MNDNRLAHFALALAIVLGLACGPAAPVSKTPPARPQPKRVERVPSTSAPVIVAPAETEISRTLTATARLLAGLPVEGPALGPGTAETPWAVIQRRPAWKAHAKTLGALWKGHEQVRLSRVRRWADEHLNVVRKASATVFYPFGGPDALYATAFFPDAPAYVLVGLEPVGEAPDLASMIPAEQDSSLKDMELYITPILQISFFRTDDMETELAERGTVPILVTFLAGTGHRILDVRPVALSAEGKPVEAGGPGAARAARIVFIREGDSQVQTLYYFSQDLSDAALRKAPEFMAFLHQMDRPLTLLKAASYLMHRPHFSAVRDFALTRTSAVLQDDSGIPLRAFGLGKWDLKFFGTYTGPIKRFKDFTQKDLLEAYHGSGAVGPLNFGIGYQHHAGESNLLLATRRAN